MNATVGGTAAFAAIVVFVSTIYLTSSNHRPLFADLPWPREVLAGQGEQPKIGPGGGTSGGPARPSVSAAATLLEDSFDRPDSPTVGPGWTEVEQPGATVSVAANRLFFDDASDAANRPLVRRGFSPVATGTLEWDFDFDWTRTGDEGIYRLLMQLGNSTVMTDASQNGGAGVNLVWTSINGAHQSLGFRQGTADTALTSVSGPAHISVAADLATRTYSVAVNGAPVGTAIPFNSAVDSLDTVRFLTDNLNEANFSGRSFDNLRVFAPDAPPPVNAPPLAQDQSVSTGMDAPRTVTLSATDPVDCELVFSIISPPVNGSLGVLADQPCLPGSPNSDLATVVYTPNAGFTGADSFVWQASDVLDISRDANVSIVIDPNATTFSDTFDRADSPEVGAGWVEVEDVGASVGIANNQLFFADTSDASLRPLVRRPFNHTSTGTLQWEFDFNWATTGIEGTYRFLMQLGDSAAMSDASQNGGAGVNLIWTSINGVHQSLGYSQAGVNTALAVISGPAHISVAADLAAQTYSVAVNGSPVGTGIPFDSNGPLNLMRYATDNLNEANFSGRTIDNVNIFSGTAGSIPPAAQDGSVNTARDVPFDLLLVFTDPDGPGPYTFSIVTPPSNGTLTGNGANRTYTPRPGFTGADSFTWRVNDGQADSNIATMTVAVSGANIAPVARNDTYATFQGTPLTVGLLNGVLANDSDANGDRLTAVLITLPPAAGGTLTLNGDGSFTFVPGIGFSGPVHFTYVADDGPLISNTAVVTINVALEFDTLNRQPANGHTNVSVNPTLEIQCEVPGTTSAQYQMATDSAFATVVYDSGENLNDICSHLAFAGLDTSTSYFWRGRVKNDQGVWSPYSQPTSFTTVGATPVFANVFQDGLDGYGGAADADIRGSALDPAQVIRQWNQGALDVLRTGRRLPNQPTDEIFRSLLRFDIGGKLADPNAVLNAYIELTGWHHTDSNHLFHAYNSMYALNQPWGEGSNVLEHLESPGDVSWTYSSLPDQWAIPGAALASDTDPGADRSETPLVQMVATNQEGYKSYWSSKNLVEAVKGWIGDPDTNFGVLIKAVDESSQQTLHQASRENPDVNFRPKLVILSTEPPETSPNIAPVALDQSISTGTNTSVDLVLTYTDSDGPFPHAFSIVTPPGHGVLTGSDANRSYTPDLDYVGSDFFTWQVNDGQASSNTATASISISQSAAVVSDNFDRPDGPIVGPGWVEIESPGASATIAGQKLFFADSSDVVNRPLVRRTFPPVPTGALLWKFDFDWDRTGNEGTYSFLMQMGDGAVMSDESQNAGAGVNLIWTSIAGTHQTLGFRQGSIDTPLTILSGPAHISVTANQGARTYSVAVDGAVIRSDIAFDSEVTLDTVRFLTDNLNELNFSGRTIDNLSVLGINAPPPVNAPPFALEQSVSTGMNNPRSITLGATDSLQCELAFSIVDGPANGSLSAPVQQACAAGAPHSDSVTLDYLPDAGFVGPDSFSFRANDTFLDSNTAQVTVTVTGEGNATTLLSDTFDRPDNPEVGQGWTEVEQAFPGATVSIAANQLTFDNTSNQVFLPLIGRSFDPVSTGTLRWDFDFDWTRTGSDTGYELWMQLGDSSRMVERPSNNGSQFTGVGVDLRWGHFSGSGDQALVARQNGGGASVTPLAVISGPTRLSVTVDLDPVPPKYSVTITSGSVGTVVVDGLDFDDSGGVSQLDTVRFITNNLDEPSFSGRAFDNVIISRE